MKTYTLTHHDKKLIEVVFIVKMSIISIEQYEDNKLKYCDHYSIVDDLDDARARWNYFIELGYRPLK